MVQPCGPPQDLEEEVLEPESILAGSRWVVLVLSPELCMAGFSKVTSRESVSK